MRVALITNDINHFYLLREKAAHITKAARSATVANLLAPMLCIPVFKDEVPDFNLTLWLGYMFVAVFIRTSLIFQLSHEAERIQNPERNLKVMTLAIGIVGVGWGLGWILMAPDLLMVNRMIYVYMTTAAMISSMFAYSVHAPTFFAFTLPIMIPSLSTVMWSTHIFPWPFALGLASLYIVVLSIAKNFAKTYEDSVRLRFRNEHLYQALATERDQSIAANTAKSKFIAVASHDLRQPMHAVNVYLDLLSLDNLPAAEKKSLSKIKNSITALNAMFDSLLNISKLDADVMHVGHRVFRLEELATTIRDLTETKAKSKGLLLNITWPDMLVRGDKLLLQQIVINLVSNAIQYTESGYVHVCFASEHDSLLIDVRDTGVGIAEAEQKLIFEQFYRADTTRALHDGLGLGLSIVQRLCHLIGASIEVNSVQGQGTQFVVTTAFPISANEGAIHTAQLATPAPHASHRIFHGKHIAIIEDNPMLVEAYSQTLIDKGAYVHVMSEYAQELDDQLATIDHIDCILSDYRLRQTTGDLLIQKLRDNFNEEIPAIIVTADTSPSHIHMFAHLNIQVLHKPISFHDITAAIERITSL